MDSKQPRFDPYNAGYDQPTGPQLGMVTQQPQGYPPGYPPGYAVSPPQYATCNTSVMVQVSRPPVQSFVAHWVLACFVYWFFGCLFGGIAFLIALSGQERAESGDAEGARSMGRASIALSVVGIVIGIAAAICYFALMPKTDIDSEYGNY